MLNKFVIIQTKSKSKKNPNKCYNKISIVPVMEIDVSEKKKKVSIQLSSLYIKV